MHRRKPFIANPFIDMTAMTDVAFLLLCFFVLATKPKQFYEDHVSLPAFKSWPVCEMSSGNSLALVLSKGRCYISIDNDSLRVLTLKEMGNNYGLLFSKPEQDAFKHMTCFGMPMALAKDRLSNYSPHQDLFDQPGISYNNTNQNELYNWISTVKKVNQQQTGIDISFEIIADKNERYKDVKLLMDNLRKQGINKFHLINNAALQKDL